MKKFEEWLEEEYREDSFYDEGWNRGDMLSAYEAGLAEAKKHFEAEKVKIHKYYEEHIHLLTETQPVKGDETNHGKLT